MEQTLVNGGVIVGLTQLVKLAFPKIAGWLTILVAVAVGVGIALFQHADPVTGVFQAFLAAGIVTVAQKTGAGQ